MLKTIVITGASSGIGLALTKHLSKQQGVRLILATRNKEKTEAVLKASGLSDNIEISNETLDLGSLKSVRDFSRRVREPVDLLINNAGAMFKQRQLSQDGNELALQVNYLSPVLLSLLLCPQRNVMLNTGSHKTVATRLDDLQFSNGSYNGWMAYCHAKRLQLLFAGLSGRGEIHGSSGEIFNVCVDPGWIRTDLVRKEHGFNDTDIQKMMGGGKNDFDDAISSVLFASLNDGIKDGDFVARGAVAKPGKDVDKLEDQQKLWQETQKLIGWF